MANDTYILGLNYIGHDASASLIRNGEVLASVMEERFSRQKHDESGGYIHAGFVSPNYGLARPLD